MTAVTAVVLLATILLGLGTTLCLPKAPTWVHKLPRARLLGALLTALCTAWAAWTLYLHPVDFLAFLTPGRLLVGSILLTVLLILFLENLLCARAIGGIMMLWPMPVILLTRDFLTTWRLVPITIGYISLTLGMIIIFHPWTLRRACEMIAESKPIRLATAAFFLLASVLCFAAVNFFGKVLGQ
jgi:hypothetical protein